MEKFLTSILYKLIVIIGFVSCLGIILKILAAQFPILGERFPAWLRKFIFGAEIRFFQSLLHHNEALIREIATKSTSSSQWFNEYENLDLRRLTLKFIDLLVELNAFGYIHPQEYGSKGARKKINYFIDIMGACTVKQYKERLSGILGYYIKHVVNTEGINIDKVACPKGGSPLLAELVAGIVTPGVVPVLVRGSTDPSSGREKGFLDGKIDASARVALVDDSCSDGEHIADSIEQIRMGQSKAEISHVFVLFKRKEHKLSERVKEKVHAMLYLNDKNIEMLLKLQRMDKKEKYLTAECSQDTP